VERKAPRLEQALLLQDGGGLEEERDQHAKKTFLHAIPGFLGRSGVLWFAIYRTGRDFVCPGLIRRISLPNRTVVVTDHPSNWSVTQLLLSALAHRFHSGGKSFDSRNFGPAEPVYVCEKKLF
jgi:hypothetical protein